MTERRAVTDRAGLTALFRSESPRIHGLLLARCGNPSIAEELTAQTFEAAATCFARRRGDDVTPAWLTTVALRRLVDHWRSTGRTSRLRDRLVRIEPTATLDPEPTDDAVRAALDSLPFNQRAAVTLRYLDDWSVAEIADGLDLTYRATESLLARARRSLRAALESEGFAPHDR